MPLQWLFLDMNSYFASCEQEDRPGLRGRPVGVVPMLADSTCVIAASYEAKAFGVKTGTGVKEARLLCPGITLVEARPKLYTQIHEAIVNTVSSELPAPHVLSIDEMACRLWANERTGGDAVRLALHVKAKMRRDVGSTLRCSIGIAPNGFLAKVATDLYKPNGLVVLRAEDVPRAFDGMAITDLPGIAKGMKARLARYEIVTVEQLYLAPRQVLRAAWGGVVGERWWYMLRGSEEADYPFLLATKTATIGHSHVLAPNLRTHEGSTNVVMRLVARALARMRSQGWCATGIQIDGDCKDVGSFRGFRWKRKCGRRIATDEPLYWMREAKALWESRPACPPWHVPYYVGVTLTGLIRRVDVTLPLFGDQVRRDKLASVKDELRLRGMRVDWGAEFGLDEYSTERIPFGAPRGARYE
jgi:DNA polymerase-4